jgi:hypothetical protein
MSKRINKTGAPIHMTPRHGKGAVIFQGTSKLMLSQDEVLDVIQALTVLVSTPTKEQP